MEYNIDQVFYNTLKNDLKYMKLPHNERTKMDEIAVVAPLPPPPPVIIPPVLNVCVLHLETAHVAHDTIDALTTEGSEQLLLEIVAKLYAQPLYIPVSLLVLVTLLKLRNEE